VVGVQLGLHWLNTHDWPGTEQPFASGPLPHAYEPPQPSLTNPHCAWAAVHAAAAVANAGVQDMGLTHAVPPRAQVAPVGHAPANGPHVRTPPHPSLRDPQTTPGGHDVAHIGVHCPETQTCPVSHVPQLKSASQPLERNPHARSANTHPFPPASGSARGTHALTVHWPLVHVLGNVHPPGARSQFRSTPQPLSK